MDWGQWESYVGDPWPNSISWGDYNTFMPPSPDPETIQVVPEITSGTSVWDKIERVGRTAGDILGSIFGGQNYPGTVVGNQPATTTMQAGAGLDLTTVALVGIGVYFLTQVSKRRR